MEVNLRIDQNLVVRPSFIPATSHRPERPSRYISYKMAGLGAIPDPFDLPNRVAIFMAGTQLALHSSTAAAMISGSAAATAAGAGGPVRPPAQVLSDLFDAWATLMAEVNPADQDAHNAEVMKVKDQITQAKADLAAEDTRMAAERAALDAQAYRPMLDQSASNDVMRRRYRSHLPPVYEARNLFNTPGAGTSNPPAVNRVEAPETGAPVQPRPTDPPR